LLILTHQRGRYREREKTYTSPLDSAVRTDDGDRLTARSQPQGNALPTQMPTTVWSRNVHCRPVNEGARLTVALGVIGEASSEEERKAEMVVGGKERIDPQTESITWLRSFNKLGIIYLTALTGEVRKFGYKFIQRDYPKITRWSSG